jgi:thioredoxin 1
MTMTFRLGACAATLALLVCGGCGDKTTGPSDATVIALTGANFGTLVQQRSGAAMVEFYLSTCPHCQAMVPIVEQLARDYASRALVGSVDANTEPTLANSYGVSGVPTFVFFKNGRELSRSVGETSYANLAAALDAAIAAP